MKANSWVDKIGAWLRANHGYLLNAGLLALLYVVTAKLGLTLAYATHQVTTVWPPTGIALVAILVMGYRYWPGVALGAFVANALSSEPLLVAAGIAVGNTLEALGAAYLLKRWFGFRNVLDTPRDAGALIVAVTAGAAIAATIGALCLGLGGLINWHNYWSTWLVWLVGDLIGGLLLGSLLLVCLDRRSYRAIRGRLMEGGLMLAVLFATSMLVFAAHGPYSLLHYYLIFPFMVWAALRFTQLGVVTSSLVVTGTVIWATVNNLGPLAALPIEQALIQMLIIVVVISETSLLLAMAISGRAAAMEALTKQAGELERLDVQLREANRRMTDILASVLDEGPARHGQQDWRATARRRGDGPADEDAANRN